MEAGGRGNFLFAVWMVMLESNILQVCSSCLSGGNSLAFFDGFVMSAEAGVKLQFNWNF